MTAYSEPPVVVTGQTMSAANWNAWVVDNFKALFPFSAAGQVPYTSAADTLAALAKPSVDSVLKNTSAGTPSWKALNELLSVAARQGGSATDWKTYGTTTYNPADVMLQCGVQRLTIPAATSSGSLAVTFPVAYAYNPIVIGQLYIFTGAASTFSINVTGASGFTAYVAGVGTGHSGYTIDFAWLSIGDPT